MATILEASLNVDSFGRNVIYEDNLAEVKQIFNLIVMKPGTDPLNYNKGIDIEKYYYALIDSSTLRNLEVEIAEQIRKYTPYTATMVRCRTNNNEGKKILYVLISFVDITKTMVVSTDGEHSSYTLLDVK